MSVKKLINAPEECVDEGLYGFSRSYPGLSLHSSSRIVFDTVPNSKRKVAVLSGGGSGHEPFPSGYVGDGMLAASVSGSIFTSPSHVQILNAIHCLDKEYDAILIVVPNYTGDVLNFGLSLEMAREDAIEVASVIVGEDVSQICGGIESKSGRRGMCGLIFVLKIVGYLSSEGENLEVLQREANMILTNMASMGLCLEACSIPGSSKLFEMQQDEAQLGTGVHGEVGIQTVRLKSATETVQTLLQPICEYLDLKENDEVVAMVNNLGALSQNEQWIVAGEVDKQLANRGILLRRMYSGTLFTSVNMVGIQICLLKLIPTERDWLSALDQPTAAPAWPGSVLSVPGRGSPFTESIVFPKRELLPGGLLSEMTADLIRSCLREACDTILVYENKLNDLDRGCGDSDCGTTLARLAKAILSALQQEKLHFLCPAQMLIQLRQIVGEAIGGTTGAIYGLFLTGASDEFAKHSSAADPIVWGKAWKAGVDCIKKYSQARIGDRTLMDSLEPSCETFTQIIANSNPANIKEALNAALKTAQKGCAETQDLVAKIGRASYVNAAEHKKMDAGAFGITLWLTAFCNVLNNESKVEYFITNGTQGGVSTGK